MTVASARLQGFKILFYAYQQDESLLGKHGSVISRFSIIDHNAQKKFHLLALDMVFYILYPPVGSPYTGREKRFEILYVRKNPTEHRVAHRRLFICTLFFIHSVAAEYRYYDFYFKKFICLDNTPPVSRLLLLSLME